MRLKQLVPIDVDLLETGYLHLLILIAGRFGVHGSLLPLHPSFFLDACPLFPIEIFQVLPHNRVTICRSRSKQGLITLPDFIREASLAAQKAVKIRIVLVVPELFLWVIFIKVNGEEPPSLLIMEARLILIDEILLHLINSLIPILVQDVPERPQIEVLFILLIRAPALFPHPRLDVLRFLRVLEGADDEGRAAAVSDLCEGFGELGPVVDTVDVDLFRFGFGTVFDRLLE